MPPTGHLLRGLGRHGCLRSYCQINERLTELKDWAEENGALKLSEQAATTPVSGQPQDGSLPLSPKTAKKLSEKQKKAHQSMCDDRRRPPYDSRQTVRVRVLHVGVFPTETRGFHCTAPHLPVVKMVGLAPRPPRRAPGVACSRPMSNGHRLSEAVGQTGPTLPPRDRDA